MGSWLLLLLILFPLIIAIIALTMPPKFLKYLKFAPIVASSFNFLILALIAQRVMAGELLLFELPLINLTILIDKFSFIFAVLITIPAILISTSIIPWLEEDANPRAKAVNLIIFYLGAIYLCAAGDFLSIVIAFLLIDFSVFAVLATQKNIRAIELSFKYLFVALVSLTAIIAGIILIYKTVGALNLIDSANAISILPTKLQIIPLALILSGIAIQSGIYPFSAIISDIHFEFPEMFSPFIPSILMTPEIYLFMRISLTTLNLKIISPYIAFFSIITILFNEAFAVLAKDAKKALVYSAYGSMGLVLFAFSFQSAEATSASLLILTNSIFTITPLFLINNAFTIDTAHPKGDDANNPLVKVLIFFSLIFILSLIGFPPFVGFFAKFNFLVLLLSQLQWEAILFTMLITVQTVFQGIYLFRIFGQHFNLSNKTTTNWYLIAPIITFGITIVMLSTFSIPLSNLLKQSALLFIQGFRYLKLPSFTGGTP
jgi:formate hydrogenlyase subunit 3/multisubunit Na+/H+ antiporter MnhD subunit